MRVDVGGFMPNAWDCAALTGLDRGGAANPGRCPGLFCAGLSGLELHRLHALKISPAYQAMAFGSAFHATRACIGVAWRSVHLLCGPACEFRDMGMTAVWSSP
jgi:hypothetical protein